MANDTNDHSLIDTIPHIVWIASETGDITFLNQQWTEMTGLSQAQGLGRAFLQAIHPEDRDRIRAAWQQAIESKQPYEAKFRLQHASGEYCRVIVRAQVQHATGLSQPLEWVGSFTNIESIVHCKDDLVHKQQFLEALLENLSDGIVACDASGTLTLFNTASQTFHGLPAEPLPAERWAEHYDLYDAEHSTPMRQEDIPLFRALKGERVRGTKMRIVPKHGKARTLISSGAPILHPDGHQLGAVVAMRDITDQEQAETEVRRLNTSLSEQVIQRTAELEAKNYQNEVLLVSEREARAEAEAAIAQTASYTERLTLVLEAVRMGTWDWDIVTNQTLWDLRHEAIFGYEPGTPNRDYVDWERRAYPDDLEWIHEATRAAMDHHQSLTLQYRIIWPDGSLHWIDAQGRFIYDAAGRPIRMIGVVRDITEQRHTEDALRENEEALRQSQEQCRATFEQAAVGIAHVGLEGRWLRVNQKLCEILGYSVAELTECTFQDITHPDDLAADLALMHQLLAGEIQTYSIEKRYFHKSGEVVWIELTVSLVCTEIEDKSSLERRIKEPQYFISVIEEINDRKQAQTELQARSRELSNFNGLLAQAAVLLDERNQELDRFVHIVSHDLKAPLRAISNLSQWIEEDLKGELSADNQQQMKLLRDRVHRMQVMIDGLLAYARAGRTEADIEPVVVAELLAEVIDSLDPPQSFSVEIVTEMPTLSTKRLLLSQVFANLISNGIKHHSRPDGRIQISSQDKGDFYEFKVADDGPGIAPEHHDKIFMIFQAVNPQNSQDSSGIGLSIVKKIVETEEGSIRLESEVGKGTAFYFTWPKQQ